MSLTASRFAQESIQHALAILQADLPADLRSQVRSGDYLPGLLTQLPFITVAATSKIVRNTGLGGTIALKQAEVDGTLVDLGYITGAVGMGELTLTLWAVTRPQLDAVRNAVTALTWPGRRREWEAPPGVLNRATLLSCQLAQTSASLVAPLPPAPPHFTINANNTDLRSAPANNAPVLGQAQQNQIFELLGRNADAGFVQGCCFNGQPFWVAAGAVITSIPLTSIPIVPAPVAMPVAASRRRRTEATATPTVASRAEIDPGTAILATSTTPAVTAWRQDLLYTTQLEITEEPLTVSGESITELRITQQLGANGQLLHTERIRVTASGAQVVNNF